MVLFERQQVVGILVQNGRGDICLTTHSIYGHNASSDIKRFQ
jgi:hypothetical protein